MKDGTLRLLDYILKYTPCNLLTKKMSEMMNSLNQGVYSLTITALYEITLHVTIIREEEEATLDLASFHKIGILKMTISWTE